MTTNSPSHPLPHAHFRSRSPSRHQNRPHKRSRHDSPARRPRALPFSAQPISKYDLSSLRPLLALYLDVQKQLDIEEISEDEVKGRWKSFVKKWNNGDLAEGWYDPITLQKALKAFEDPPRPKSETRAEDNDSGDEHSENDFGPSLPTNPTEFNTLHKNDKDVRTGQSGAFPPTLSDLRARREEADEEAHSLRTQNQETLRLERRAEHKTQVSRLDELLPRAEAGTRERQLEKKHTLANANRSFAASAHEQGDVELKDCEVMGDDGVSDFKRMKQNMERKKTEREVRREEVLRARISEREERGRVLREKEEKTMRYLLEIKRERFG